MILKMCLYPLADNYHGAYGYNNSLSDMWTVLIASGPAFKSGYTASGIDIIDLYPLLCHILGVQPQEHDGRLGNLQHLLQEDEITTTEGPADKDTEPTNKINVYKDKSDGETNGDSKTNNDSNDGENNNSDRNDDDNDGDHNDDDDNDGDGNDGDDNDDDDNDGDGNDGDGNDDDDNDGDDNDGDDNDDDDNDGDGNAGDSKPQTDDSDRDTPKHANNSESDTKDDKAGEHKVQTDDNENNIHNVAVVPNSDIKQISDNGTLIFTDTGDAEAKWFNMHVLVGCK